MSVQCHDRRLGSHSRLFAKTPESPPTLLAHLGQAWTLELCFASYYSPLTNSNSNFPTLWYTWHASSCTVCWRCCMRISVTRGASSPQSTPYFRCDCSGLYAKQASLTWLPCSCIAAFSSGAPVCVAKSFLFHTFIACGSVPSR